MPLFAKEMSEKYAPKALGPGDITSGVILVQVT